MNDRRSLLGDEHENRTRLTDSPTTTPRLSRRGVVVLQPSAATLTRTRTQYRKWGRGASPRQHPSLAVFLCVWGPVRLCRVRCRGCFVLAPSCFRGLQGIRHVSL